MTDIVREAEHAIEQAKREDERTVSVLQAMEMAGVSRRTVFYWIRKQVVRSKLTAYGARRIYLSTLPPRRVQRLHSR